MRPTSLTPAALRPAAFAVAALAATPAGAHVGHLGEAAGHDHWVAGAALGAAVLAGLWAAWQGRREGAGTEGEPPAEAPPEAPAGEAKT